jgi:hypothetical protein
MTRDRTHYVGDDCPGGHRATEPAGGGSAPTAAAGGRITNEDIAVAVAAATDRTGAGPWRHEVSAALESVYRPGGIVDRAVATELERVAGVVDRAHCAGREYVAETSAHSLRQLAIEWREGRR